MRVEKITQCPRAAKRGPSFTAHKAKQNPKHLGEQEEDHCDDQQRDNLVAFYDRPIGEELIALAEEIVWPECTGERSLA